jgi:hypothetical protein
MESLAQRASYEVAKLEPGEVACHPAQQKDDHCYPAAQPLLAFAGFSCLLPNGVRSLKKYEAWNEFDFARPLPGQTSQSFQVGVVNKSVGRGKGLPGLHSALI